MPDNELHDKLEGLFSDILDEEPSLLDDFEPQPEPVLTSDRPDPLEQFNHSSRPAQTGDQIGLLEVSQPVVPAEPYRPEPATAYSRPGVKWRLIIWAVLLTLAAIILVAFGQALFFNSPDGQLAASEPRFVIPLTPTPSITPPPTATLEQILTFVEPTATMTPVPGGRILVLTPAPQAVGWVVSDAGDQADNLTPNQFGDLFLYAGIANGRIYHAAFQFSLDQIPRGSQIHAASLHLAGLRSDQLSSSGEGEWQVQMLATASDYHWRDQGYQQLNQADVWTTLEPVLTQAELGIDRENLFEFSSEQLRLLERRLLEGSDQFGKQVSFRVDGPSEADTTNLFAWDSGNGLASRGTGPELRLSVGPPPRETPPPYYVVITSTPTPENISTAVAISARMTSRAKQVGTATPLPPSWVTPYVVTATPTAQNQATAQLMRRLATAVAMTTGQPANLDIVTATPSPTYVIITSTPTPEEITTAVALAWQATAQATRGGPATLLPPNWVTPLVVTSTPVPENQATADYHQAVRLTTGTPTPLPANSQTATPTSVAVAVQPLVSPTPTATASPTPQAIPAGLLGKIVFLSDREGATTEERERADRLRVTPQVTPQPYVFDPATGQLERLTARWPYDVAVARDAWSADTVYEAYAQQLLWTNVEIKQGDGSSRRVATEVIAIHFYDHIYGVEQMVTELGAGIAYDPAWSPVSEEIAFVATESGNDEIWLINRDGTNPTQLTRNMWEWDKHPSWSPDGQQIVFFSNRTGRQQLWIMNKDGSNQRLLMEDNPYNDFDPVWVKYLEPAPPLQRQPDWRFVKPPEEVQGTP